MSVSRREFLETAALGAAAREGFDRLVASVALGEVGMSFPFILAQSTPNCRLCRPRTWRRLSTT